MSLPLHNPPSVFLVYIKVNKLSLFTMLLKIMLLMLYATSWSFLRRGKGMELGNDHFLWVWVQ